MVKRDVIHKKLRKLDEYLAILHDLQHCQFEEFSSDPRLHGSAERFLHLAIEATIDIGNHIIADDNLGVMNYYNDIPAILAEKRLITSAQQVTWTKMIGFRNVLVHDYADIDQRIVYDVLQNRLQDIEDLKRFFATYL